MAVVFEVENQFLLGGFYNKTKAHSGVVVVVVAQVVCKVYQCVPELL